MEQIGERGTADEVGWHGTAGRTQPASGIFAHGVTESGGQELKCAENDQVQRHEFLDGGKRIGGAVGMGRHGGGMRSPSWASGNGSEILGPEMICQAAEQVFK